jgi:hypothetical protein
VGLGGVCGARQAFMWCGEAMGLSNDQTIYKEHPFAARREWG